MRVIKPVLEGTPPAEVSEAALDACLTFVLASRELIHCVDPAVEVFGGPEGSVFVPAKLAIGRRWLA